MATTTVLLHHSGVSDSTFESSNNSLSTNVASTESASFQSVASSINRLRPLRTVPPRNKHKNVHNQPTQQCLQNEQTDKIGDKPANSQHTEPVEIAKKDPIKYHHLFMNAMKNAILRYLDKQADSNRTEAEESIFCALGYDTSMEYQQEEEDEEEQEEEDQDEDLAVHHHTKHSAVQRQSEEEEEEEEEDEGSNEEEDEDMEATHQSSSPPSSLAARYSPAFVDQIKHYRCHHIMRHRDAIRTFRLKQVYELMQHQHPSYGTEDILSALSNKLDSLYLPSPSPPSPTPIIEEEEQEELQQTAHDERQQMMKCSILNSDNASNHDAKHKQDVTAKSKTSNASTTTPTSTSSSTSSCSVSTCSASPSSVAKYCALSSPSMEDKNKHKESNTAKSHKRTEKNSENKSGQNELSGKEPAFSIANAANVMNMCLNSKVMSDVPATDDRDLSASPSQIYITMHDVKKQYNIHLATAYDNESDSKSSRYNMAAYPFQTPSRTQQQAAPHKYYPYYQGLFVPPPHSAQTFSNEEDEVLQKMAIHKKSRKRKFTAIAGRNPENQNFECPQNKKRTRYGNNTRIRSKSKGRNRTRGGGVSGDRSFNENIMRRSASSNDNRSNESFENDEDDGSDIDLPVNTNSLSHV
eukprot:CAMPEP_0197020786 /NCGR_PEP_ID=MMETSP1384-20130603/1678_1 /TAXON_ID=29189 /ORGANISM="Ammonia sp." /LENGTH=636 /DNA_ID=CAMNT_0042448475 /DNA_START=102 /DNA_END=2012 /DNA_ORIENTATION=+